VQWIKEMFKMHAVGMIHPEERGQAGLSVHGKNRALQGEKECTLKRREIFQKQ
jgi:hypothetical protein